MCLAVAQVLLGARSEHHWLRMCYGRLGHLFPYLPKQPGCHKRLKAAAPLICRTMACLARLWPSFTDDLRLLDAAWCLADPKLGEREVAAELLGHARDTGALKAGMIVLADKGLAGPDTKRRLHPDRPAAARPGRRHLAQLDHPDYPPAVPDRL